MRLRLYIGDFNGGRKNRQIAALLPLIQSAHFGPEQFVES